MGEINGIVEKIVVCMPHRLPMFVKAADGMSCTLMQKCMKSCDLPVACIPQCGSWHQPALPLTTGPEKDVPETPLSLSTHITVLSPKNGVFVCLLLLW